MLAPSKTMPPPGFVPTGKLPIDAPSLARSLVTVPSVQLATQTFAPSKATAVGLGTGNEPSSAPSLARIFLIAFPPTPTQMWSPSKARLPGLLPTVISAASLPPYQRRIPSRLGLTTWACARPGPRANSDNNPVRVKSDAARERMWLFLSVRRRQAPARTAANGASVG